MCKTHGTVHVWATAHLTKWVLADFWGGPAMKLVGPLYEEGNHYGTELYIFGILFVRDAHYRFTIGDNICLLFQF